MSLFLTTETSFFYDNRDNKNNGKNENDGHPFFFTLVVFVVSVVVLKNHQAQDVSLLS